MVQAEETDHFGLLEERVESLITLITTLKAEKESLTLKNQTLENENRTLAGEASTLQQARDRAKERIISLLEKMEQLNI